LFYRLEQTAVVESRQIRIQV